ncbi:MAG: hypothetical protein U0271_34090 [Polyangiaceae bacterium]
MTRTRILMTIVLGSAPLGCSTPDSGRTSVASNAAPGASGSGASSSGASRSGVSAAGRRATAVVAGMSHSCALADDGRVFCWGSNEHGQLGAAAPDNCPLPDFHGLPPAPIPCREQPTPVDGLADVVEIAAGGSTTCARLRDGTVRCWGDNGYGIVGDGTTTDRHAPVALGLTHVAELALSSTHACARHEDGSVDCWGLSYAGQLGTVPVVPSADAASKLGIAASKVLSPQPVPGLADVVEIAVGMEITCARVKSGDVLCFGKVEPRARGRVDPVVVPALHGASKLLLNEGYPGTTHCALFPDGAARCWGVQAGAGPLLAGSTVESAPVLSTVVQDAAVLALSQTRACSIDRAGALSCWGDNGLGARPGPARVSLTSAAAAVAMGPTHACALGVDGSVSCWGDSFYGQAGVKGGFAPTSAFWTPVSVVVLP